MLVYQKILFDRNYCKKSFCLLKTSEERFEKFIFELLIMARKSMKDLHVLKTPVPEQRPNIILMSINYVHLYACYC